MGRASQRPWLAATSRRGLAATSRRRWLVLAVAVASLAAATLIAACLQARSNGCIFDDGAAYCRMALGKLAPLPFARRVAVPAVVAWLPRGWGLVPRFEVVALVAAFGVTIGTGLLTHRLVRDRAPGVVSYPAAIVGAALMALSPHLFRLALTEPVLVDQAAMFIGLVWCLLATARSRPVRFVSPLVILVLIPTREAWLLPLLLAAGVMWWMGDRRLAVATLAMTAAGAIFTFTRPRAPGAYNNLIQVLHDGRVTLTHPDHALWAVFFGIGFIGALALALLLPPNRLALGGDRSTRRLRGPTGLVLAVGVGHLVQAPLAGTDVSRYAAAALPFAVVLAVVVAVELGTARAFWALVALVAASALLWQPFRVAGRGVPAYASMYYPGGASAPVALGGLVLIAMTLGWVVRGTHSMAATPASPANPNGALLTHPPSEA